MCIVRSTFGVVTCEVGRARWPAVRDRVDPLEHREFFETRCHAGFAGPPAVV